MTLLDDSPPSRVAPHERVTTPEDNVDIKSTLLQLGFLLGLRGLSILERKLGKRRGGQPTSGMGQLEKPPTSPAGARDQNL